MRAPAPLLRSCATATRRLISSTTTTYASPISLRDELRRQHAAFLQHFVPSEENGPATAQWMQTYYRRPTPQLLIGGLVECLTNTSCLLGRAALPSAVFLTVIFRRELRTSADVAQLIAAALAAASSAGGAASTTPLPSESLDTVLRALRMTESPHCLARVVAVAQTWREELLVGGKGEEMALEQLYLPESLLLPSDPSQSFLQWDVPSLNLSQFQSLIEKAPFPCYGATRHLLSLTRAFYLAAGKDRPRFLARLPDLAASVSEAMVDAHWAHFYATGDAQLAVTMVLNVATPYVEFFEEYGDAWVTRFAPFTGSNTSDREAPSGDAGIDYSGVPGEFDGDAYNSMRFSASRYALWTLLTHAATHTVVGECFTRFFESTYDRVALLHPLQQGTSLTAFGDRQLLLMRAVYPAVQEMRVRAEAHGIGSGVWPSSYDSAEDRQRRHSHGQGSISWGVEPDTVQPLR